MPAGLDAASTVRFPPGLEAPSPAPFSGLNLGTHVGDDLEQVQRNRHWLKTALALPQEPTWLEQIHSNRVVNLAHCAGRERESTEGEQADAMVAFDQGVCAVMTADCLPVLLCDQKGRTIAAAHAGWRGLAAGILENTVAAMNTRPQTLMAWLGPAIGPAAFEVGAEVVEAFVSQQPAAEACFQATDETHYLADIYGLARLRLKACGVDYIYGGEYCTYLDSGRFYSYRRDGQTGRMASLIWFK
ncbi:conserved hypothetical protein TIGR00726 [gamma proteobacterium HTCC5015]|nr:conserved hypothetical protein TIGR00726 [gamma proteobacterium HTCC5015]